MRRNATVVQRQLAQIALLVALILVLIGMRTSGLALMSLFGSMRDWVGEAPWSYVVISGAFGILAFASALLTVLVPSRLLARRGPLLAGSIVFALLCGAAALTYDGRTSERRMVDGRDGSAGLAEALGPGAGAVLWIAEESESWFLARRAAFFNEVQGAPILFSRDLAIAWVERRRYLARLGLVREVDSFPWASTAGDRADVIKLTPESLKRLCSDPGRPAALVAPGEQLAAVPPGLDARLWSPPWPFRRLFFDGGEPRWRTFDVFTVVRCTRPMS